MVDLVVEGAMKPLLIALMVLLTRTGFAFSPTNARPLLSQQTSQSLNGIPFYHIHGPPPPPAKGANVFSSPPPPPLVPKGAIFFASPPPPPIPKGAIFFASPPPPLIPKGAIFFASPPPPSPRPASTGPSKDQSPSEIPSPPSF
ncbi:PREDICTED: leucine-rich repeat extensin-like protein 3 [Populus euphratica]|uniref:Leucine-rich repeat extensin-like protein 3 n=1 Tax=Populus euphratica TaxID=75702 RepID=A0AAJ6TX41_POPEU|nr:PREDICTED: leucine-rich repeat extensin-like protein 3 [Populus euphratica]